jgi:hypothetical protein
MRDTVSLPAQRCTPPSVLPVLDPAVATADRQPLLLAAAVAAGLGTGCSVYAHGGVTLGHVVLLALLPVVASAVSRSGLARAMLASLALWCFAAVMTSLSVQDTVHHLAFSLCRPLTVTLSLCGAIWAFTQRAPVARAYAVSLVLGLVAATVLCPSAGFAQDPWKFGLGPAVSLAAVLAAAALLRRGRRVLGTSLVAGLALVNLEWGFRSEFLVVSLAGAAAALAGRRGLRRPSWARCLRVGAALAVATALIYLGYGCLAGGGQLGAAQQYKWNRQSHVAGGLLIGGRAESLTSEVVVAQTPLFGRGISPEVGLQTREAFLGRLQARGVPVDDQVSRYYFGHGLYLHSTLFQTWAENGPLVLPGLLLPLVLVGRALAAATRSGAGPAVLVLSFVTWQLAWDMAFSPWPRLEGTALGTAAGAALVYLAMRQQVAAAELT